MLKHALFHSILALQSAPKFPENPNIHHMKCCSQKKLPKTSISQVLDSLKICTDIHRTINHPGWISKTIRPGPCITKQCGKRSSLPINYIPTNMFHYRHSPHCIFSGTISMLKEHNIWLMHYKIMR
jgi:hypothetical protein